jgi:putative ABC transport system permease protein
MRQQNVRHALHTLRNARGRSLLTMFGIIIGVVAVILTLSIGKGVKQQVAGQINQLGKDVIVIRPGQGDTAATTSGAFRGLQATSLTEQDVETIRQTAGVERAVPLGVSGGFAEVNGKRLNGGTVIATSDELPDTLDRKIEFGTYFTQGDLNRNVVVVGRGVAEELFEENVPIGRTLTIRGQDYIVRGVFEEFISTPGSVGTDLNLAVFIPYPVAVAANGGHLPVAQILVQLSDPENQKVDIQTITKNLAQAHGGQQDFTVLDRQQELANNDELISLLTQMVAAIAALSLLVGGIGIVNIMLVSVSERTHEIGIRKAVGATNRQIRNQFLVEATTLSVVGGLIGVLISLVAIFLINVTTDLQPVIPFVEMGLVLLLTWAIGITFGVAPAIKAARKEPIEALRYE